jgi:hypothetical protein
VKGRQISDNIRLLKDVLEYTKNEDMSGILISVDYEKAIDSVE